VRRVPALLVLLFLVTPIVEIYVILQVGQLLGAWPTVALLLGESLLGAWIVRREGRRAWLELRRALASARMPDRELADAALLLIGGTLLLTPGFVTDAAGFLLVLPPTRAVARRLLLRWIARRAAAAGTGLVAGLAFGGSRSGDSRGVRPPRDARPPGRVVPGQVVPGDAAPGTGPGDGTGSGDGTRPGENRRADGPGERPPRR
jgi:UPF0716 protein FxsA